MKPTRAQARGSLLILTSTSFSHRIKKKKLTHFTIFAISHFFNLDEAGGVITDNFSSS